MLPAIPCSSEPRPALRMGARPPKSGLNELTRVGLRRVAVVHVRDRTQCRVPPRGGSCSPFIGRICEAAAARNAADLERVLSAFGKEGGGLIVTPSALTATRRELIIALADRLRLPAIYSFGFYAESGGLMSYGINQLELVRSAASYVDRILRGTSPGDLPVQLPLRYELVINLKTAAAPWSRRAQLAAAARRQSD
jgi:ABC transporter substrate binding protein